MSDSKDTRLNWSKLVIPPELADLLFMIAKVHGYRRDELHRFLYAMLKMAYPDDVATLADYLGTGWLDHE